MKIWSNEAKLLTRTFYIKYGAEEEVADKDMPQSSYYQYLFHYAMRITLYFFAHSQGIFFFFLEEKHFVRLVTSAKFIILREVLISITKENISRNLYSSQQKGK